MLSARDGLAELVQRTRVLKYRALSTCPRVSGSPIVLQPVLFVGDGAIVVGRDVEFGWPRSTLFYTGYCHVEASHAAGRRSSSATACRSTTTPSSRARGPASASARAR